MRLTVRKFTLYAFFSLWLVYKNSVDNGDFWSYQLFPSVNLLIFIEIVLIWTKQSILHSKSYADAITSIALYYTNSLPKRTISRWCGITL